MAKVLIADDDPDFVEVMRTILTAEGYDVVSAKNGNEALKVLRKGGVDVVLLDVMMATMLDGVSVAHEMQKDPALKLLPIIMISSIISSPHAAMFPTDVYIPMDAWITKPVAPADLLAKLDTVLKAK